ncbi:MAG: NmrA family NAD(P)-binding protein [Myxococcota bacterium]
MSQTFLVTGGTGAIGTAFIHEIASRGMDVRFGTRKPDGAAARLRAAMGPGKVEPVVIDPKDDAGLARAFDGVTGALLVAPFEDMPAWHSAIGRAAHGAGVAHVVKVSVTGARPQASDPPPGRIPWAHYQGELALLESGVNATMVRPTIFAQHFLGLSPALFKPGDTRFHLPTGERGVAFVDCRDIALCAARILLEQTLRETWRGRSFELTGPTAVTASQIAQILEDTSGREIAWVDGAEDFSAHAKSIGVPDGIQAVYREAAEGWFADVRDSEFVEITGRYPTSFAKFAFDHRSYFSMTR